MHTHLGGPTCSPSSYLISRSFCCLPSTIQGEGRPKQSDCGRGWQAEWWCLKPAQRYASLRGCLAEGFQTARVLQDLVGWALGPGERMRGGDGRKPKMQHASFVLGTFPGLALYPEKEKDVCFSFFYIPLPSDCVTSVVKSQN